MPVGPIRLVRHAHACVELVVGRARVLLDPGELGDKTPRDGMTAVLVSHNH